MDTTRGVSPRYAKVLQPAALDRLRRTFRSMNRWMILLWRLGLGRCAESWPSVGGRILVIEHRGRKSGNRYLTPLNFTRDGSACFCLAAFGSGADWYRNVMATHEAVVWLPDGRWSAAAADVTDEPGARGRIRRVLIDSGFAARLFGLDPRAMTDEEIAETTATYRLVRLETTEHLDDGYADLAWAWIPIGGVATALGVARILKDRR